MSIGLRTGAIDDIRIKAAIEWVIRNMGVCFVPAGVGIMEYLGLLQRYGITLFIFTVVTSFVMLWLVGFIYQKLTQKKSNLVEGSIRD